MAKSPQAKADRIEGGEQGAVVAFSSGRLTAVNGTVKGVAVVMPFAGNVIAFMLNVDTAFTHASASVGFGTLADEDSHLDDFGIQNFTGSRDLIGATWVSKALAKGTVYTPQFKCGDTTGNGTITWIAQAGPGQLA